MFEKPQKGNPHGLTVWQHTFPKASISRFTEDAGFVSVCHLPTKKLLRLEPEEKLFCAKRVWNQRAENGYMKKIEDDFQLLVKAILAGKVAHIGYFDSDTVSRFFALWNIRALMKHEPVGNQRIVGIAGLERDLTKDEQEILESNHYGYFRPDQTFPGRDLAGLRIQMEVDFVVRHRLAKATWGIVRTSEGEFIVPDQFADVGIVPVTPHMCFVLNSENAVINKNNVVDFNVHALTMSIEYYFARNFARCF